MKKYILLAMFALFALPAFAQNYYLSCSECEQIYETNCDGCPSGSTAGSVSFEGIVVKSQTGQIVARIPAPLSSHYDSRGNVSIYTKGVDETIAGSPTNFMAAFSKIKQPTGASYSNYAALLDFINSCGGCVIPTPQVAQELSIAGDNISLSGGGGTVTVVHPPNLDNDPANEYNTSFDFATTTLSITDGGGLLSVDLSSLVNTDNQQLLPLSFIGNVLTVALEDGGTQQINLSGLVSSVVNNANATYTHTDGNGNPTNIGYRLSYNPATNDMTLVDLAGNVANTVTIQREYNTALNIISNNLNLTDGGGLLSVSLLPYLDNTDNQTLSLSGQNLSISNGNTIILPADNDPDPTNELNTGFGIVANQLSVTDAGGSLSADLTPYLDNTDDQTLSITGDNISITGGNTISITHPANLDNDPANELNTAFTLIADQLTMTDAAGALTVDLSPYNSPDTHLFSEDKTATDDRLHNTTDNFNYVMQHGNTAIQLGDGIGLFNATNNGAILYKSDGNTVSQVSVGDASSLGGNPNTASVFSGDAAGGEFTSFSATQTLSDLTNRDLTKTLNFKMSSSLSDYMTLTNTLTGQTSPTNLICYRLTDTELGYWDGTTKTGIKAKSGLLQVYNYMNTRDDSGTTTPINFLYTDPTGHLQSAPLSQITTTVLRDLNTMAGGETSVTLTGTPTANNNIVLSLNGQILYDGIDWTAAGSTISFISYVAVTGDIIEIKYF